jgi:lipase chaperone LimK
VTVAAGGVPTGDRRHRPLALAVGIALVAGAGTGAWWWAGGKSDADMQPAVVTLPEQAVPAAVRAQFDIPPASGGPLPASLQGTSVDGSFTLDGAGSFIPDRNALRLFDYYFSANGEESSDVIRGRILLQALSSGLSGPAAADVAAVLDRYIAYRDAAKAALAQGEPSSDIEGRVAALRALQLSVLGPDLQRAFYGDDARVADIDMQRLAAMRDKAMGEAERQRAIAAIDAQLPADIRDARKAASTPSMLHGRAEALRASGGSKDEIAAIRREAYGSGAAERLGALDAARARWDGRLTAYRAEADRLRAAYGGATGAAYTDALDALRRRHFSTEEQLRVRALDAERP